MAQQSFQLVIKSGPNPGKTFVLSKSEITIGRDSNNDVVINDAEISRKHARLLLQQEGYLLEDLGSTNGTFVNGQRLMGPHALRPGELILLGENVTLTYEAPEYDPDATVIGAPPKEIPQAEATPPPPQRVEAPPPPPSPAEEPSAFAGQIPSGPAVYEEPPVEQKSRTTRNWVLAGCGCLLLFLCGCLAIFFVLDQLELLCNPLFRPVINGIMAVLNPIFGTNYFCP